MRFLILLALFWSMPAPAAVSIICHSVKDLSERTEDCEDNKYFAKAGADCMRAFDRAVKEQSDVVAKLLQASNQEQIDQAGNAQHHTFGGSASDYKIAVNNLNMLIVAAKIARATVDGYLNSIYYPEDFDAPPEVIGDPMEYLDNSACYAENEKSLKGILRDMDKKIVDLEKAKAAAAAMGKTSSGRQSQTDSLTNDANVGAKEQGKAQAAPKGKAGSAKSTITGVEENKKKQSK